MARRKGTDGSLLASLPWTLAALGIAIAPHLPYLPAWIILTFTGCALVRWQIERRRWRLPGTWVRLLLALFCFVGVLFTYETISGVGPGSALLTVMAALKLLETRARRDQFVLLFLSIFLIMASLLREQFVWSLPYLLIGIYVTMSAWLQMSGSRGSHAKQAFGNGARLMAYAAPLMLVMWIFFPRISTPFWAVPVDTSLGVTGLSDEMSPGDISSLSASNAIAFRVRFDDVVPPARDRYWRGLVLHRFNGRTWTGNEPTIGTRDSWPIDYLGEPVRYEITMEPTRQHWVFALDLPYEWSLDMTFMGRQQQLSRAQPIDQRVVYSAVSYPRFRLEPTLNEYSFEYHLRIPENNNPRTRALAADMREAADSDRAYIDAVMRMFNEEDYFYTLEPPALGRNSVDEFLFRTRRGFCEHFASAFAILMRAAGIPSRIVVGYQGGQLNPMSDYLIVRQTDVHAWTEVWLDGDGWVRVDPTSAVAPERIESGMMDAALDGAAASWGFSAPSRFVQDLTLAWDMINAKWNEWILAYGGENQRSFMEWLGMDDPDLRKMLLTMIALVAVLLIALTLLLGLRFRPPPVDEAQRLYQRFTGKCGVEPGKGEAPLAYLSRLEQEKPGVAPDAGVITELYLKARYGDRSPETVNRLKTLVSDFRPINL